MVEWKDLTENEKQTIESMAKTQAGKRMLDRRCPKVGTKLKYSQAAFLLSEFLRKPIDDLVNEYIEDVKANMYSAADKWEEVFKDFTIWLKDHGSKIPSKKLKSASVGVYFAGAKALINANVPRSMRLQAESPKYSSRTIPGVTMDDLREIYSMCDERERAFISFLKDSGISADDALRLNYGDVKGFETEEFVHMNMYRGKEEVEYETFIGPNAVETLRAYTTIRKNRGENITPDTPIFASEKTPYGRLDSDGLFMIFHRIKLRTRKVISTHRLRKFFETYMALTVRHPIILKYWMGHKIFKGRDVDARYIIPPELEQRKLYMDSYKNINLTPRISAEELSQARIRAELETMNPEARKRYVSSLVKRYTLKPNIRRLIEEVAKEFPQTEKNGGSENCPNGVHCEQFKQVGEGQLLDYLRNGWQIVHKLATGEVIVKR